ncbi:phosphodiester glycosidase family protein, partial [Streptococcus suis]
FEVIYENEITAQELIYKGVVNLLSFGPSLVENGEIVVDKSTEVGRAISSNPRSAIWIIDENHYIIFVEDGLTSEIQGL